MPEHVPYFRVFVSSPGDVTDERKAVLEVLERLPNRPAFREKVGFRVVAWDKLGADTPMLATMSPQAAIDAGLPKPSECDIVVCIFWSRMGTPFVMKDVEYQSGTQYELLDALGSTRPTTMIFRRTEKKLFDTEDAEGQSQYKRVQDFFDGELFFDPATRHPRRGVNHYAAPADFREKFETYLEEVVVRLLHRSSAHTAPGTDAAPLPSEVVTIEPKRWRGSPFPGLRSFVKEDALIFFGRERETDALLKRVAEQRFVAVVGASGSGKSSLVGAGLLPRLEANAISDEATGSKDWHIVQFTPGQSDHPFAALFDAVVKTFEPLRPSPFDVRRIKNQFVQDVIADPMTVCETLMAALETIKAPSWAEVLLFIDQFEELFTLAKAETILPFARMLEMLVRQPRLRAVLTMRHDFVHRAIEIPELAALLNLSTLHLAAPNTAALAQMIKRPAELAALELDDGLPEQILSDMSGQAGALALMAYTLDELYKIAEKRHDRRLTFADYAALEGVQGAIGKRAEQTFSQLTADEKEALLARVFRELVEVDERGTATRQRCAIRRFDDSELALVCAFTDARLLVTDENTVEVAHEALFRSWERLKNWIAGAQEDLILLRQVRAAAHDWQTKREREPEKDFDYLRWPAERLTLVYTMLERLKPELNEVERDFIEPEQKRLLRELETLPKDETSHERRRDIGNRLAVIGDMRTGVGVKDGIPALEWLPVPSSVETYRFEFGAFEVKPFLVAKYLITYLQFQIFVDAEDGFNDLRWWDGMPDEYKRQELTSQRTKLENAPRDSVSWYQSVAFARWMNYRLHGLELEHASAGVLKVGRTAEVRLPTEWEWQWAAQGGGQAKVYAWGNWKPGYANTSEAALGRAISVGMYPHGGAECKAMDMTGSLWEWCLNDFGNPKIVDGFRNGKDKVLRGGSFNSALSGAATSIRTVRYPDYGGIFYGLRLVLGAPIRSL